MATVHSKRRTRIVGLCPSLEEPPGRSVKRQIWVHASARHLRMIVHINYSAHGRSYGTDRLDDEPAERCLLHRVGFGPSINACVLDIPTNR